MSDANNMTFEQFFKATGNKVEKQRTLDILCGEGFKAREIKKMLMVDVHLKLLNAMKRHSNKLQIMAQREGERF